MNILEFADLLRAAEQQAQPQRLLLVFASAELPADATAEETTTTVAAISAGRSANASSRDRMPSWQWENSPSGASVRAASGCRGPDVG